MKVESMTKLHVSQVVELEKQCFSKPWSEKALLEELEQENSVMLVATSDDKVLGYGGMQLLFGEGYVTNIAVFKAERKKGIGQAITEKLIDLCQVSISLEVRQSNKNAISLYEKLGFQEVGKRKNFYDNPVEDGLIYTLQKGE